MRKAVTIVVIVGTMIVGGLLARTQDTDGQEHSAPVGQTASALAPELATLLSEEMLAIEEGLGELMTAIAAGNWPQVAETSENIERSYILAQRLTAEQFEELGRILPPRFKALDSAFHGSAGKLAQAARERDAELAVFHSYKLMEACVECHATFASTRFPGFGGEKTGHQHH